MSDRYEIKKLLGEGGFGETFAAIDQQTGTEVVVKKLHLKHADDWKAIELFEREAEVLETLDHPKIPNYLDYYEEKEGDEMRLCLVQERAPGVSLQDKVASGWRCDDPEKMLRELLDILIYLQSLKPPIVHRDIKPSNIVVAEDGSLSLVDFGAVANALTDSVGGSTMIGTLGYMAPEQQIGRVEMNTDLFGTAMSVVFGATGFAPDAVPRKKMKADVSTLPMTPNVRRCLDRMLEIASEDRFNSAHDAMNELSRLTNEQLTRPIGDLQVHHIEPKQPPVPTTPLEMVTREPFDDISPIEISTLEKQLKHHSWSARFFEALILVSALTLVFLTEPLHLIAVGLMIWLFAGLQGVLATDASRRFRKALFARRFARKTSGSTAVAITEFDPAGTMVVGKPTYPAAIESSRHAGWYALAMFILVNIPLLAPIGLGMGKLAAATTFPVTFLGIYIVSKLLYFRMRDVVPKKSVTIDNHAIRLIRNGQVIQQFPTDGTTTSVHAEHGTDSTNRNLFASPTPSRVTYRLVAQHPKAARGMLLLELGHDPSFDRSLALEIANHIARLQKNTTLDFEQKSQIKKEEHTAQSAKVKA